MPVLHMEPPVAGINARDALDGLAPNEALELVNWVPDVGYMRSRNGHFLYVDLGTSSPVETLMPLRLTVGSRLIAASNLQLFDITDKTSILTLTLPESLASSRMTYAQFKNHAILTQQGITPMVYTPDNGASNYTLVTGTFTEYLDPDLPPDERLVKTNLVKPVVFKGRVIYVDSELLSMWYCAAGSYQGELTEFPLDGVFQRGGKIKLMFTWSKDMGGGMDDMLVIMSTTGEALIYQGDDPSDALGWELVQRYQLPTPISDVGMDRIGAENIIITDDGYINLSEALSSGQVSDYATFSGKISRLVKRDLDAYQDNFGWAAVFYPRGNMMLFNVPIRENAEHYQHIINTRNGAWTTFRGWNANSIVEFDDALIFGDTGGKVWTADSGTSDDGSFIDCECITAFTQLDDPSKTKHMTSMTVIQNHNFPNSFSLNAMSDFRINALPPLIRPLETNIGQWDVSEWDEDYWGTGNAATNGRKYRRPIQATGHSIAFSIRQSSLSQNVYWFSSTIEWTSGGRK